MWLSTIRNLNQMQIACFYLTMTKILKGTHHHPFLLSRKIAHHPYKTLPKQITRKTDEAPLLKVGKTGKPQAFSPLFPTVETFSCGRRLFFVAGRSRTIAVVKTDSIDGFIDEKNDF